MKKIKSFCITLILLLSLHNKCREESAIYVIQKANTKLQALIFKINKANSVKAAENQQPFSLLPKYSLEGKVIQPFYSSEKITLALLHKDYAKIAQFQSPRFLEKTEYPTFNSDCTFLLILTKPSTFFYNTHPTKLEWQLFDLNQEKTIKKFPYKAYPRFDPNNPKQIVCYNGHDNFTIPTKSSDTIFRSFFTTIKSFFSSPAKEPTFSAQTKKAFAAPIPQILPSEQKFIPNDPFLTIPATELLPEPSEYIQEQEIQQKSAEEEEDKDNNDVDDEENEFSDTEEESLLYSKMTVFQNFIEQNLIKEAQSSLTAIIFELENNYSQETKNAFFEMYNQYPLNIKKEFSTLFFSTSGGLYKPNIIPKTKSSSGKLTATIIQNVLTVFDATAQSRLPLLTYSTKTPIRALQFNSSGNRLAVSYEKREQQEYARLDVFNKTKNNQYERKEYYIPGSSEIIGLKFINNSTLLTLDADYIIQDISI